MKAEPVRLTLRLAPLLLIVQVACTAMPPTPSAQPVAVAVPVPVPAPAPAPASAAAEPTVEVPPPPTGSEIDRPEPRLPPAKFDVDVAIETTRSTVRSTAEWLARGVDSWFGDRPFEDGGKVTNGRASLGLSKRETENVKFSLRFNARFRLPNLERRAYVFVGRDNPRELVTDKPGALSDQSRLLAETRQDRSFFAGLGRDLSDSIDLRLGFRGVKPYAQARYRYAWDIGEDHLVEFRQTLFWTVKDSFGSTTALSWERAYSSTVVARWVSAATITRETRKFGWSSVLGGYKSYGNQRLLSLEAMINGEQSSGVGPSDYGVQARWAQPIFEKRLVGEVVVGRFWPRPDVLSVRSPVWALGGNLKMEF